MSDDNDEIVILASATIIFSNCALLCNNGLKRKKRDSVRVRGYLQSRTKSGAHNCPVRDLQVHAEDKLKYYIRMDLVTFAELFRLAV